jgi:hypothetical protein
LKLNTRYYVLSLSERSSRLYEAFRDTLIDIQNKGFPIEFSTVMNGTVELPLQHDQSREFIRTVDRHFDHYLRRDPLRFVVVGEKNILSIFESVTAHHDGLIGAVQGDYAATSPHDLGKIVWPIVKNAMAGTNKHAMNDLATADRSQNVAFGIETVGYLADSGVGGTLFVEEDYRLKGGIRETDHSLIKAEDLDIREPIDDAVDAIVDRVLDKGGNVVFLDSGSLTKHRRIALIVNR